MSRRSFEFLLKFLLYMLPLSLFFSYYPVIGLGGSEAMNFELSVPLVWLVVFDVVVMVMLVWKGGVFKDLKRGWMWLMLPLWLTVTVVWSLNQVRGVLTVGILWLIYLAVYGMWKFRKVLDEEFRRKWWRWFFGAALIACVWCVLQCVLDLAGVSRECTLMCAGCTYYSFGFPHPNGFAIEPQFMGNLLLAPAIVAAWLLIKKQPNKYLKLERSRSDDFYNGSGGACTKLQFRDSLRERCKNYIGSRFLCSKYLLGCFFSVTVTLFLTFSRGAIYGFVVGMVLMSVFVLAKKWGMWRRVGLVWLMMILAFLFTLNLQGIMAAVSPTNDTYGTGVAKVLNQLSLGVIDVRGGAENDGITESEVVENFVEKSVEEDGEENGGEAENVGQMEVESGEVAVFDGYVEESTNTRLRLTGAAIEVWRQDLVTAVAGVGLGGAGWALYNNSLSSAPKEIVQNEYMSLLLEAGVIGVLLAGATLVLVVRVVRRSREAGMILTLLATYGVTLCFFSGLPNALQIYLLPGVMMVMVVYCPSSLTNSSR